MNDKTELLQRFDDAKLIDVVKNYRQYGYDDELRQAAITILNERGITTEDLKLAGNFSSHNYNKAEELAKAYDTNSKITLGLYLTSLFVSLVLAHILGDSEAFHTLEPVITIAFYVCYFIFLIRSFINQSDFYAAIGKKLDGGDIALYYCIGTPFYIFMFFFYKGQMREEMKTIK